MTYRLSTRFEGSSCTLVMEQLATGVIYVRIDGHDVGEFGDMPQRCVAALIPEGGTARLFSAARQVRGVTVEVSGAWARWLGANRAALGEVHMLTSSRQVEVSAGFVRRFTSLEAQMHLHTDAATFERALVLASA